MGQGAPLHTRQEDLKSPARRCSNPSAASRRAWPVLVTPASIQGSDHEAWMDAPKAACDSSDDRLARSLETCGEEVSYQLGYATRRRRREITINRLPTPTSAIPAAAIPVMLAPVKAMAEWFMGWFSGVVGAAVATIVPPSGVNTTFEGGVELPPVELPPVEEPSVVVVVVDGVSVVVVVVGFDGSVLVVVVESGVSVVVVVESGVSVVVVVVESVVVVVVESVVVVVVVVTGAPSWQPDTVSTEWSVPVIAEADVSVAPSAEKMMKCTAPFPCPPCVMGPDVLPAGENAVEIVNGPVPGEVRMNNHACWPSGTVTGRRSELAHSPALVPLPVQVIVPLAAPACAPTIPKETLRAMAAAVMAATARKRVQNRPRIFMIPSPCPIALSGAPSQVRRITLGGTEVAK